MKYDMIIFDIDGTLWNVAKLTAEALNIIASNTSGLNKVSVDDINNVMGLSSDEIIEKLYSNVEYSKAKEALRESLKLAVKLIDENGGDIYDGVIDTIKYLSQKYKLGIVTNNYDSYAELFIKKSGLKDYFIDYIGTSSYNLKKSEAIKLMVERNNISKACYIGDIKRDMEASRDANVDFIHAKYGFDKSSISDVSINNIEELKNIL